MKKGSTEHELTEESVSKFRQFFKQMMNFEQWPNFYDNFIFCVLLEYLFLDYRMCFLNSL